MSQDVPLEGRVQITGNELAGYGPHFIAFIDLLGFAEASMGGDAFTRSQVLAFLFSISSVRGEFDFQSKQLENSTSILVRPTITAFSDHIVISYPLAKLAANLGSDDNMLAVHVLHGCASLLDGIAGTALAIGFLIRGGATIGNLYHSNGIVFGEALVEAYQLESRTAIYPRVVLSQKICSQPVWMRMGQSNLRRGSDGLYYFNYYRSLVFRPGRLGLDPKQVFLYLNELISKNLAELERTGNITAFSKWTWFASELYSAMSEIPLETRNVMGLDIEAIPKAAFTVPSQPQAG